MQKRRFLFKAPFDFLCCSRKKAETLVARERVFCESCDPLVCTRVSAYLFAYLKIARFISRSAIRTFKHIMRLADRKKRQHKKQCQIISACFPDKLRHSAATLAAILFRGSFRT